MNEQPYNYLGGNDCHETTNPFLRFHELTEGEVQNTIEKVFSNSQWVAAFKTDTHHGIKHGDQVRQSCYKLVDNLTDTEQEILSREGTEISSQKPQEHALTAIGVAAIFHDCGRFDGEGKMSHEQQNIHQITSTERALIFCEKLGISKISDFVAGAIMSHDFQSERITPHLRPPKTIIGKIIQASDQMGWFHPDSVTRTIEYNKQVLGNPFFDSSVTLQERLAWTSGSTSKDALTVMLNQLFGPTTDQRFGIEYARKKVESYRFQLEKNIVGCANSREEAQQVQDIINACRSRK
jgi:hypothetical protein